MDKSWWKEVLCPQKTGNMLASVWVCGVGGDICFCDKNPILVPNDIAKQQKCFFEKQHEMTFDSHALLYGTRQCRIIETTETTSWEVFDGFENWFQNLSFPTETFETVCRQNMTSSWNHEKTKPVIGWEKPSVCFIVFLFFQNVHTFYSSAKM